MGILVIEKQDLKHNIKQIKEYAKKINDKLKIIAIVKSNGYGLGLEEYANFLIDNGIDYLAVASTEEAIKLREAGIKADILMMSSTAIEQELENMLKNNITITIGSTEAKEALIKIIKRVNKKPKIHIKIDTGFGRYGYLYTDTERIIKDIKELQKFAIIEGIFSHFSTSFYKEKWTNLQYERFLEVLKTIEEHKINIPIKHIKFFSIYKISSNESKCSKNRLCFFRKSCSSK